MNSFSKAKLNIQLILFTLISSAAFGQSNHKQLLDSAEVANEKMHYQSALIFLQDALEISNRSKNQTQIAGDILEIGKTYMSMGEMDQALESFFKALRMSDQIKNDSMTFEVVNQFALYHLKLEIPDNAKKYIDRTKILADKLGYSSFRRRYYNVLGIYERRKGNMKASISAYKKCIEFISPSMRDELFNAYVNLSTAYVYNNELEIALTYLSKAEKLNQTMKNDYNSLVLYGQTGRIELLRGNAQKAIQYYELGFEHSKKAKNSDMIERFARELARSYHTLGNYEKAYHYYAAFVIELEKSHAQENATAIAEMSAKYEDEKKEQKIESLEEQSKLKAEIHQTQIDRRNLWIAISLLIVLITIVIAFLLMKNQRNKQRLKLELIEQQKELAKQEAELKGQEVERNRLSRELHDGLGGTLASIKMRLSSKNIDSLDPILQDLDAACLDVRNMSHSLSSQFTHEIDFYSLLKKLVNDLQQRSSLKVNLEFMPVEELNQLAAEPRHQCYRIIQELTNNVVKHAHATTLTIGLMKNENDVIVLVEDNGIGFEPGSMPSGIGISNVRKRLETINGNLDITSSLNKGSIFAISFPFIREYEN